MTSSSPCFRKRSKKRTIRLLILGLSIPFFLLSSSAVAETKNVVITEAARIHFGEGIRFLESNSDDRFLKAYEEFRAAYAKSPSWKILGNLGIVAQALERNGEAIDSFLGYLKGGAQALDPRERQQFERDLKLLALKTATLELNLKPLSGWVIDERLRDSGAAISNRYAYKDGKIELRVAAGVHKIRLESENHAPTIWNVTVESGQKKSRSFVLPSEDSIKEEPVVLVPGEVPDLSPAQTSVGPGPMPYVLLGSGAIFVAGGIYAFIERSANIEIADAAFSNCLALSPEDGCPRGSEPAERSRLFDSKARDYLLLGIAATSLGALAMGTGTWWLLNDSDGPTRIGKLGIVFTGQSFSVLGNF